MKVSFQSIHQHQSYTKKQKNIANRGENCPSFIQTVTVGFGVTPNHALRLAGYTASGELHPALKTLY